VKKVNEFEYAVGKYSAIDKKTSLALCKINKPPLANSFDQTKARADRSALAFVWIYFLE
jgi:hypothetical protein